MTTKREPERLTDAELAELERVCRGTQRWWVDIEHTALESLLAEVRELRALGAEVLECYGEGAEPNLGKAIVRLSAALERGR